jgi:prepilin peptidase CpaA
VSFRKVEQRGDVMLANLLLVPALLLSCISDLTTKKIPNWLTFSAMGLGFVIYGFNSGLVGIKDSALGLLLGLGLLFIPFALGGMGAGDVKLLGAVGALKGAEFVFRAFIGSAFAGGALALMAIIWRGKLWACLKWSVPALKALFYKVITRGQLKLEVPPFPAGGIGLPYGVAISVGTLAVLVWG